MTRFALILGLLLSLTVPAAGQKGDLQRQIAEKQRLIAEKQAELDGKPAGQEINFYGMEKAWAEKSKAQTLKN